MRKSRALGLAACLSLGASSACLANDLRATEQFAESTVAFDLQGPYSNATLTVTGPNRFHASTSAKSGTPSIELRQFGALEDGQYSYQLTAATEEKVKRKIKLDDGREGPAASADPLKSVSTSGTFRVKDGVIVKRDPNLLEGTRKRD